MNLQTCQIGIVTVLFCISKAQGCPEKNVSCNDIKTDYGFKFLYQCPEGSNIFVYDNKTTIAHGKLGTQSIKYSKEVMSVNNVSVITRGCGDLQIKCIVPNGKRHVKEVCVDYKITEKPENPDPNYSPALWGLIIGVSLGVIGLIGIIVVCCCYISWKKAQHGAAPVSGFLGYLQTCSCLRKENSQAERGEAQETSATECNFVQEVTAGDLGTQHNGVIRLSAISASDPRGSGENNTEQDNTLQSVHVHSIDPNADGKIGQSFCLDHNSSNEGIQPTESGDINAPDINRASNHRAMNRILGEDPGGMNDLPNIVRKMHNGLTLGDRGPEDHGNEGQPLLSNQGAAIQGSDMTGEAAALVNKRRFDPDQVSRCSTPPDTDVESMPNMKNCTHRY